MNVKEPYHAIVITVLQKITKKPAEELTPDTTLIQIGPTIDVTHLGYALRLEGKKRGVRLGPKLTRSLQGADMEAMTIRDLRDVVAYAGGEDFTPWPKKKKPAEQSPPPSQSPKKG